MSKAQRRWAKELPLHHNGFAGLEIEIYLDEENMLGYGLTQAEVNRFKEAIQRLMNSTHGAAEVEINRAHAPNDPDSLWHVCVYPDSLLQAGIHQQWLLERLWMVWNYFEWRHKDEAEG